MTAPVWVLNLIEEVCAGEGVSERPKFSFSRSSRHLGSSGNTTYELGKWQYIHVTAGSDPRDLRHVVLHELAHWLGSPRDDHGTKFYERAFRLFAKYGDPKYSAWREARYKRRSAAVAMRMGIDVSEVGKDQYGGEKFLEPVANPAQGVLL